MRDTSGKCADKSRDKIILRSLIERRTPIWLWLSHKTFGIGMCLSLSMLPILCSKLR